MSVETIAGVCAVLGVVLIVVCVAMFDWRVAIGVTGGFLVSVGLVMDRSPGGGS